MIPGFYVGGLVVPRVGATSAGPTDITLTGTTVAETSADTVAGNTVIGTLGASGGTPGYTFSIQAGGTQFDISGTSLRAKSGNTLTNGGSPYSVTVRVTDSGAQTYDEVFSITVTDYVGATTIDTLKITNNTGSTIPANFSTDFIGLVFAEGDIPAGQYPQIEAPSTDACALTIGNITTWPDGSMKRCSVLLRSPDSLAGSTTADYVIKNGGSAPGASGFTDANFNATASRDLKVEAVGFENLSGTHVSELNQGITDNDWRHVDMDGDAGRVLVVNQAFRSGGSDHPHLQCRHYVAALKDGSGGVAGWLWMPKIHQPWMNTTSPARRAFDMRALDGASALRDFADSGTFTYSGTANRATRTAHGITGGEAVRLTSTGTLPTGLNDTTVYFVTVIGADTLEFRTAPVNGSLVTWSTAGTGTHTMRKTMAIEHHGAFFAAPADGRAHYIAGTVATRPDISCRQTSAYMRLSKLHLPYDDTVVPDSQAAQSYVPGGAGAGGGLDSLRRNFNSSGGGPTIALSPTWCARDFLARATWSETNVRVLGLMTAHPRVVLLDETSKQPPVFNNKTYSGLAASDITLRYGEFYSGVNTPPSRWELFFGYDWTHMNAAPHYAWLTTGCPWFRDIIQDYTICALINRWPDGHEGRKYPPSGGAIYHATCFFSNATLERMDAWSSRDTFGAWLLPDSHPDGSLTCTHLRDLAADSSEALQYYLSLQTSDFRRDGIYPFATTAEITAGGAPWSKGFLAQSCAWGAAISSNADALANAQHFANWLSRLQATCGMYHANAYRHMLRNVDDIYSHSQQSEVLGTLDDYTVDNFTYSTNAGTDVVTIGTPAGSPAIANGDRICWQSGPPGGLTATIPYYVINVSGATCQVALTAGGSAIDITTSVSGGMQYRFQAAGTGPAGSQGVNPAENNNSTSYTAVILAAAKHLKAAGCTGLDAAITDLETIAGNATVAWDYDAEPKNALVSSFT